MHIFSKRRSDVYRTSLLFSCAIFSLTERKDDQRIPGSLSFFHLSLPAGEHRSNRADRQSSSMLPACNHCPVSKWKIRGHWTSKNNKKKVDHWQAHTCEDVFLPLDSLPGPMLTNWVSSPQHISQTRMFSNLSSWQIADVVVLACFPILMLRLLLMGTSRTAMQKEQAIYPSQAVLSLEKSTFIGERCISWLCLVSDQWSRYMTSAWSGRTDPSFRVPDWSKTT